jgi:signal-transduction protein with cAMP-binding, CBS, and nucleotidyltransferase domain
MVEKVITVKPNDTIKTVAELMNQNEIGCVIVINHEKPVGIVTERDMIKRVICKSAKSEETKVSDIMSHPLVDVSPNMTAGDAAKLMLERNIKKLPVVQNGQLVGLVTLTDLIRSEGVIESLNGLALNGISTRMKKVVCIYFDAAKQHRKRCPLIMKDGFAIGCQIEKCMWWTGDECAITKLSRHLETIQISQ